MSVSRATVNPSRGTIRILVGSDDDGADLSTEHDLAPWPIDEQCEKIATKALNGMGWDVSKVGPIPDTPDGEFVVDVTPAS